jgi:2-amino-4-hydroxy-6-hydroxymethyldihydropteridine diphosphokinase
MATALLSLGSNLGDRALALRQSLEVLARSAGMRVTATSSFHETKPVGGPAAQENFLNAAALLETSLPPREFFSILQAVENQLGRVRDQRWGPRTIDLDLLLYDQLELETPELTLPHPRMSFRRFVLEPSAEIAADMVHPVCGNTIGGLLRHLNQSSRCIAIVGLDRASRIKLEIDPRFVVARSTALLLPEDARLPGIIKRDKKEWLIIHGDKLTQQSLVQFQLLVVLGASSELSSLREWIRTKHRGPTLLLANCDPDQLREEVLAAISAMTPTKE